MKSETLAIALILISSATVISAQLMPMHITLAADNTTPNPPNQQITPNPPSQPTQTSISLVNPLGTTNDIEGIISNIMKWLVTVGGAVAALMIIVGGIQILTSGGKPEGFEKGKKTILYTAIGYGIILIGSGIISIVKILLNG